MRANREILQTGTVMQGLIMTVMLQRLVQRESLQELCHTMILFISLKRMGTTDCMETDRQIMRSHGMPEKGYKKDQERVSP